MKHFETNLYFLAERRLPPRVLSGSTLRMEASLTLYLKWSFIPWSSLPDACLPRTAGVLGPVREAGARQVTLTHYIP